MVTSEPDHKLQERSPKGNDTLQRVTAGCPVQESVIHVSNAAQPEIIYDYYNFPPEAYHITYPAPGDPEVAQWVSELLGYVSQNSFYAFSSLMMSFMICLHQAIVMQNEEGSAESCKADLEQQQCKQCQSDCSRVRLQVTARVSRCSVQMTGWVFLAEPCAGQACNSQAIVRSLCNEPA